DGRAELTLIVVLERAPKRRLERLQGHAQVLVAPERDGRIDLPWLLGKLGRQSAVSLLVEGGGEVHASVLLSGLVQRIAFFDAPRIIGGRTAAGAVGGSGVASLAEALEVGEMEWRRIGRDFLLTGRLGHGQASARRC